MVLKISKQGSPWPPKVLGLQICGFQQLMPVIRKRNFLKKVQRPLHGPVSTKFASNFELEQTQICNFAMDCLACTSNYNYFETNYAPHNILGLSLKGFWPQLISFSSFLQQFNENLVQLPLSPK